MKIACWCLCGIGFLLAGAETACADFTGASFTFNNGAAGTAGTLGIPGTTSNLQTTWTALGTPASGNLDVHYTVDSASSSNLVRIAGSGGFITNQTGVLMTDLTLRILPGSTAGAAFVSAGNNSDLTFTTAPQVLSGSLLLFRGPPGLANGATDNVNLFTFISTTSAGTFDLTITPNGVAAIPEPGSIALVSLVALGAVGVAYRWRRKQLDVEIE